MNNYSPEQSKQLQSRYRAEHHIQRYRASELQDSSHRDKELQVDSYRAKEIQSYRDTETNSYR